MLLVVAYNLPTRAPVYILRTLQTETLVCSESNRDFVAFVLKGVEIG